MKTAFYAVALSAALILTASTGSARQAFHHKRECTTDLQALCAGIAPGQGHIHACLEAHMSELSVGCSAMLSKAAWVAKECHGDIQQFCPHARYGGIANCMRPHLGEASEPCRSALAFIASPAGDR